MITAYCAFMIDETASSWPLRYVAIKWRKRIGVTQSKGGKANSRALPLMKQTCLKPILYSSLSHWSLNTFILFFLLLCPCITKQCFDWKVGCVMGGAPQDWDKVLRKTTCSQAAWVKCCFLRWALKEHTQPWVSHAFLATPLVPVLPPIPGLAPVASSWYRLWS